MMTSMTAEHRKLLRRTIGHGMMLAQSEMVDTHEYPADDIIPEILAALLSLASFISKHNTEISREEFLNCCVAAANECYPKETEEGNKPDEQGTLVPH